MSKPVFSCDKNTKHGRCGKKPYVEVYWKSNEEDSIGFTSHWSYLCRWHFYIDRVKNFLFKGGNFYADAELIEDDKESSDVFDSN